MTDIEGVSAGEKVNALDQRIHREHQFPICGYVEHRGVITDA